MVYPAPLLSGQKTLLAMTFACSALFSTQTMAEPELAPSLDLPTSEGRVSLADLRGKVVLVDFWASWCGPCRQSFPWMNTLQEKYQNQGLEVVAVNLDQEAEAAAAFLSAIPADFTVAYDPDGVTPEAYGVMGMPSAYLIDREGRIHSQHIGFHIDRIDNYEAEIQSLLQAEATSN
ncbi:TlpA family protein disulfide reductase [Marinobacter mobilis]|uniref:Thiol-disulfide isomerase or thioredoxin n=1 Tax=Marinobacter mobilis TaxID=488533 RepID=A0A1H3APB8_9GAMM|nr:TlpA disulfide reductase family protein [Marinobacter mobilis]SDX31542.1 Thiol-disulfide isomerase or thioredoxin [Marinobacter mobilis]